MAESYALRVDGARQLRASLRRAGQDMTQLKAAHGEVASIVEEYSIGSVPVRSGALMGSIRSSGSNTASTVRAGGARVQYAGVIHWGWPQRGIAASNFITNAAQASEPVWRSVFERAVQKALDLVKGALW